MLPDPAPSNDLYVVTSVSVKEKLMTYSESDIAIVGMNCRYPGVHSVAAFETVLRIANGLGIDLVLAIRGKK